MIVSLDKQSCFWHSPVRGYINNASFILILHFLLEIIFFEFGFVAFICVWSF